jgi:1,4-alpha-glucan branching enzyme
MIHNHSAEDYAKARVEEHYQNFMALNRLLLHGANKSAQLDLIEAKDNLFPWMNAGIYRYLVR